MPPKGKKGKGKDKGEDKFELEPSDDGEAQEEMDLLNDLNEEFFAKGNRIIQALMEHNRFYEAQKIKKYIDIVFNLHRKYEEEVKENEALRPQISIAENKLRVALELTTTSEESLEKLKEALSNAWKESDASIAREQEIQEKFQEILIKCESLENKESDQQDDAAEFGSLAKYKNIILRERDRLNGDVMDLEKRLQMQRYYAESLEYIIKNNEDSMMKMSNKVRAIELEKANLDIKNKNLMGAVDEMKDLNNKTNNKLDHCFNELTDTQNKLLKKSSDFEHLRENFEKLKTENNVNLKTLAKNDDEINTLKKTQKENEETIRTLRLEDRVKTITIQQLTSKYKKAANDHNALSQKMYKMNRNVHHLNEEIMRLKNQINGFEKDILNARHNYDELRRLKDNVTREKETLRSDIVKLNNQITDFRHTIVMHTNTNDALRLDINKLNIKLDEAKVLISKAERERDEMSQEVEGLHEKIEFLQDQLQVKTDQITDLSEKLQHKHFTLINVKKQLETVHSQKMTLQRNLETCTQERDGFRILQSKTSHLISQLTNETQQNQNRINSLNLRIEHLNTEKKEIESQLRNTENMLSSVRKDLKEMKQKNVNLLKTIGEDELKIVKISTELEETRKEKNLVGLQMVRRNDEIVLLKEKLSIVQTALDQGQTQYNQRVEDIRLLKSEVNNLRTERNCLTRALKSTANMRLEVIRLQRLLNQERIRVRSLTEDARMPTGVHRWRILKGEDPERFELITKVQVLQRRYIKQEIVKSNLKSKLEESKKLANDLKHVVESFPTVTVKERLVATQRVNRLQERKLKALKAELALRQVEMKDQQCSIDTFKTSLKECNKERKNIVPFAQYYDLSQTKLNDCNIAESSEALPVLP